MRAVSVFTCVGIPRMRGGEGWEGLSEWEEGKDKVEEGTKERR